MRLSEICRRLLRMRRAGWTVTWLLMLLLLLLLRLLSVFLRRWRAHTSYHRRLVHLSPVPNLTTARITLLTRVNGILLLMLSMHGRSSTLRS